MVEITSEMKTCVDIKEIKNYVDVTGIECYFKKTNINEFENVLKKNYNTNYKKFAHRLINNWVLTNSNQPRKFSYSKDYLTSMYEDSFWAASEQRKFYDLTKFYYFKKNPITKLRNPIGLFYVDGEFIPAGRFRVSYMMHLPRDLEFYVSYSKKEMFENLFLSKEISMNDLDNSILQDMFDLNNNKTSTLIVAKSFDQVSITEPHKYINFFDQDFCVEFDGNDIYVNETKIVKLKNNTYKILGPE